MILHSSNRYVLTFCYFQRGEDRKMPGEEKTSRSSASATHRYKIPEMNWTKDQGLSNRFKVWKEDVKWILKVAFKDKTEEFKAEIIQLWAGHKGRSLIHQYLSTEKGSDGKDCKFKKLKDYWTCFEFVINQVVSHYTVRDELFRCIQGNQPVEEYLTQQQRLTDLMDYTDGGITADQLLLDKMVTGVKDAHLRQKLYQEGKDLTMEKAVHIIRIYAAMHKAQGMTKLP